MDDLLEFFLQSDSANRSLSPNSLGSVLPRCARSHLITVMLLIKRRFSNCYLLRLV